MSFSSNALAQGVPDQAQREHEQRLKEQQQREQERERRDLSSPDVFLQLAPARRKQDIPTTDDASCIDVKSISVSGVTVFGYQTINAITRKYASRCLRFNEMNRLIADISNLYLNAGYITSRAFVQPQKIEKGTLDVLVVEGEIELLQSADGRMKASELKSAFPGLRNRAKKDAVGGEESEHILYLRDLEQGIEQINRLHENNAQLDIQPGKEVGQSIVNVVNDRSQSLHGNIAIDNSGSEQTGEYVISTGIFWDNPVNRSDSLYLNLSRSVHAENGGSSQSYAINYSIPQGYCLWSAAAQYFNYRQTITGASLNFITTGKSDNQTIRMDHVAYRSQRSKWGWNLEAIRKDTKNYIEDVFLETSSHTLYMAGIGIQSTYQLNTATFRGSFDWTRSIAVANATQKITAAEVDYQFNKFNVDLGVYGRFESLGRQFNYSSVLHYFYTPTAIVASEALSLGGRYTIRGFDHESVTGYRGGYWRNDISTPLFLIEKFRVEPFLAYDFGQSDAHDYLQRKATLSGVSAGVRFSAGGFFGSIAYSKALSTPGFLTRGQREVAIEMQMSF